MDRKDPKEVVASRVNYRFCFVFALIAFTLVIFPASAQLDTSRTESRNDVSEHSPTINAVLAIPDSAVIPIEVRSGPPEHFLQRYNTIIAALLGSLLAGLIAVYSVWRTNQNAKLLEQSRRVREDKTEADIYCGLLHAVAVELDAHRMVLRDISRSLPPLREECLDAGHFIVPKLPFMLPLSHMNVCRTRIMEYKRFNTELLNEISAYLNSSSYFNSNLDFTPLIQMHRHVQATQNRAQEAISDAFDALLDHLQRLVNFRPELRQHIIAEVRRFPGNIIHDEEGESEDIELWNNQVLSI